MKTIVAVFSKVGRRNELVGFDAFYGDHLVGRFDTKPEAERALDSYVYEELAA